MENLSNKIKLYLDREVDFDKDVILQDDGDGAYIKEWNAAESEPTITDLDKIDVTSEVALAEILSNRQAEYPSVQELVVALYDTDDKSAVEAKRAAVKLKYPKP